MRFKGFKEGDYKYKKNDFCILIINNKRMEHIYSYIYTCHSYKLNEIVMKFILCDDKLIIDYKNIVLLLSQYNDKSLIIQKERKIMGKSVIPFNYRDRNGDIMSYLDKYIIITFYPLI